MEQTDEQLIGYCDLHSESERALFHKKDVAKMVELAGCPEDWPSPKEVEKGIRQWYSLHEDMKELVELARKHKKEEKLVEALQTRKKIETSPLKSKPYNKSDVDLRNQLN